MIIKFKKLKKYKLQMTQQGGQPVPTFEDDFVKNLPSFDFLPKTFVAYNGIEYILAKQTVYLEQSDNEDLPVDMIVVDALPTLEHIRPPTEDETKEMQAEFEHLRSEAVRQQQSQIVVPGATPPNISNFPGQKNK